MQRSFTIVIDFTDDFFEADIPTNVWPEFEETLMHVGAIDSVCLNHCCYVEADVGNTQLQTVVEIAEEIEKAIRDAIERWRED